MRSQPRSEPGSDIFGSEIAAPGSGIPLPEAEDGVALADGEYRAERYGYVYLVDNCLSVVPPFWMDSDAVQLHWCLLDGRRRTVTREMVQAGLDALQVSEGVNENEVKATIDRLADGKKEDPCPVIAEGTPPVHGTDTELDFDVEVERDVGEIDEEGEFFFNEDALAPNVQPGQLVASVSPPTAGTDGKTLRGEAQLAKQGSDRDFEAGANVEVRVEGDVTCFYSKSE
ncbi:MAG: FapA family protein, partial [Candidatus Latescibacteria bacterium]|nr:FapA family protein [Candidatus Latescibacterota bacterium]